MTNEELSTEERMLKLIERLSIKTHEGQLHWERTANPSIFQTSFPSYVVRLNVRQEADSTPDYVITVRGQDGTVLEQTSDVEISKAVPSSNAYTVMADLFARARRQALGVNEALDSLLSELE